MDAGGKQQRRREVSEIVDADVVSQPGSSERCFECARDVSLPERGSDAGGKYEAIISIVRPGRQSFLHLAGTVQHGVPGSPPPAN